MPNFSTTFLHLGTSLKADDRRPSPRSRRASHWHPRGLASGQSCLVPGDLLAHDCLRVRMQSGVLLPWEFERRGESLRIDPPSRLILGSPNLAVQAAVADAGVAYVIERAIENELTSGRLVSMLEDWTPPFAGVCLYYPRQRLHSAGLAAFLEHFRAERRRESAADRGPSSSGSSASACR